MKKPLGALELIARLEVIIDVSFAGDAIALQRLEQLKMRLATLSPELRKKTKALPQALPAHLPKEAPEKWQLRKNRDEMPLEFIKRVYAQWLGQGLCRHHLKRLDASLYNALCKWLCDHKMPTDIDLPTKSESITRQLVGLAAQGVEATHERRLHEGRLKRNKKKTGS